MSSLQIYPGYFVVFGGFLLHLSIGNIYTYNHISPYLIDYMRNCSYSNGSVNSTNLIWILSLSVFGLGSSITIGGVIAKKIGPSLTVLLGGWFMSLNVLLMSFTMRSYLSIVILSYGLCTGIGSGIVYGVAIGTAIQWFPKHIGLVSGIIVSGFGLSAFIFDILQSLIIDTYGKQYLPLTYIIMGSICFTIQFIGSLLIYSPPEVSMEENEQLKSTNETKLFDFSNQNSSFDIQIQPHQLYLELDYWILWITMALLSSCLTLIMFMTKEFGSDLSITDNPRYYLTIASIIGAVCNSLGRIVWGYLIDHARYKNVMFLLTLSLCTSLGTFYLIKVIQNSHNTINNPGTLICYFIWDILLYFIPSGIFSIFPKICLQLFGLHHFVANFGMIFTSYSFGGLITGLIVSFASHNFLGICIAGSVMSLFAALVTLGYRGRSLVHRTNFFY